MSYRCLEETEHVLCHSTKILSIVAPPEEGGRGERWSNGHGYNVSASLNKGAWLTFVWQAICKHTLNSSKYTEV